MNARMYAWNDSAAANARGAVVDAGNFASLFRSTQSTHISHLQCKDFIVRTSWNTNTHAPLIPSSQHTPEQFANRGQAQFYCCTLIRCTECLALKKLSLAAVVLAHPDCALSQNPLFSCVEWRVLQLSQLISDFRVYTQDFVYMRPQWSHSKNGYIFERPYFCLRRMASVATLSAHCRFSSVYPVFCVYETPMLHK